MTTENLAKSIGRSDSKSKSKADQAKDRTAQQQEFDSWPAGSDGAPMAKITMTAAELVPTGQYANVSIGPAQITCFVDVSRALESDSYFTKEERETLAAALNELAEVVEGDVIAVQRNLVMESIQRANES